MVKSAPPPKSAAAKDHCTACGKSWVAHKGIIGTCEDFKVARQQLIDLRIAFFVLCLKCLPPGEEFTAENVMKAVAKKRR